VKKDTQGASVSFTDKAGKVQTLAAERVLMAVGRVPKTENLGLEKIESENGARFCSCRAVHGKLPSRACTRLATLSPGCRSSRMPRRWKASVAWRKSPASKCRPLKKSDFPTRPIASRRFASIGLTERAAREAGYAVKTGKFPFLGNSKATILGHHEGFIKVVTDEKFGEILGVHIIGRSRRKLLRSRCRAAARSTVDDMMSTVHAHPTVWKRCRMQSRQCAAFY